MSTDNKKARHLEDVYEDAGGMGVYQWLVFILVSVFNMFGVETINVNFVNGEQGHWCKIPELQNLSHVQQKYIAVPQQSNGDYESCKMFDLDYNAFSLDDFLTWNRTVMTDNAPMTDCSDWVFDQSLYVNTVTSRFRLVCGDSWMVAMISTIYMVGVLVSSLVSGMIADRFGRKPTICGGIMIKLCGLYLVSFTAHYSMTCVGRFLMGAGHTATYLSSFVVLMEILNGKWRTTLGVVYQIFYSFGFMMWPARAYLIRDDLKLQMTGAISSSLFVFYFLLLDESPMWLLKHERYDEANRVIRKMAATNHAVLSDDFDVSDIKVVKEGEKVNKNCLALLSSPTMRRRTIVADFYWFTVSLMYFALSLNTGALSGDIFINTMISGAVEIPGNILAVVLLGWHVTGRRITTSASLVIAGVSSFITVYMILEDIGIAHTIFSTVAKGFVTLAYSATYIHTSEVFPTEVRNAAMGTALAWAHVSGMAAPYVGGPLGDIWAPLPPIVYGSFGIVAGLLALLLPETLGVPLFETIEQVEAFEKGSQTLPIDEIYVDYDKKRDQCHANEAFEGTYM